jgi:hypothetical protein
VNLNPPNERQGVTIAIFALALGLLLMARENPQLWDVKLFEIIVQATFISGIFGSIVALHFAANKSDQTKAENTGKAFDAITATAAAVAAPSSAKDAATGAADAVATAAADKADEIAGAPGSLEDPA